MNAEREALGKKPIEDNEDDNEPQNPTGGGTTEKTVSTTDPESGMFVKGEHERQFAHEAHTALDSRPIAAVRSSSRRRVLIYLAINLYLVSKKLLLRMRDDKTTNIAAACGFDNPSYFTEVFTKEVGLSPTDYRNNHCGLS